MQTANHCLCAISALCVTLTALQLLLHLEQQSLQHSTVNHHHCLYELPNIACQETRPRLTFKPSLVHPTFHSTLLPANHDVVRNESCPQQVKKHLMSQATDLLDKCFQLLLCMLPWGDVRGLELRRQLLRNVHMEEVVIGRQRGVTGEEEGVEGVLA